ncbi:uncharacterized protein L201_001916 [Kwoniella dendrophila CBS 6074]|uniref:CCD97-like C-terminal domain-containing protein n=1 Tax=Kwoniella dendrophila CBS 6074 TaxID=1295534 RepID=A0AAX4JNT5_9TREE
MSQYPLSSDQVHSILSYLDLPQSDVLPKPPILFLKEHISKLPFEYLVYFSYLTPKELGDSIPIIKQRRLLYATSIPKPEILSLYQGRLRWPLLWERLGGDPNFLFNNDDEKNSKNAIEEEEWVSNEFMNDIDKNKSQQVKKLGGFLRILEEERESEQIRLAKMKERNLDSKGEEFDDESDEDDDEEENHLHTQQYQNVNTQRVEIAEDQEEVERIFEKRLLEIFLDGMDTIDYTQIDFNEPPRGDPIAVRDAEDRYFDDEEPSKTPNGHDQGRGKELSIAETRLKQVENGDLGEQQRQNGQGEYDY